MSFIAIVHVCATLASGILSCNAGVVTAAHQPEVVEFHASLNDCLEKTTTVERNIRQYFTTIPATLVWIEVVCRDMGGEQA